nr:hypothetical protein BaRGS_019717 [Batillaria attramentaria]
MVGRVNFINPERVELKVDVLTKKSQNKSFFFTADNYNERVFVLDTEFLLYYGGSLKIAYEEDGLPFILYVFAKSREQRDGWEQAIRAEALKNGAYFSLNYHPAVWDRRAGFGCCGAPSRSDEGCTPVTRQTAEMRSRLLSKSSATSAGEVLADIMVKRSQGKSTFFGATNYKERVFVLKSHILRYFSGNLRKRGEEKGRVELSTIMAVEEVKDGLLENRKNAFQVMYKEDDEKLVLIVIARSAVKRTMWIQAIREEAKKNRALFVSTYHPGVWTKTVGKFNCCNTLNKESLGCEQVTLDLASFSTQGVGANRAMSPADIRVGKLTKRAQNKSSFYVSKSYKERVFVLNTDCLRYFSGSLKKRGDEKGCIPLSSMVIVAPLDDGALDGRRNAFQVVYREDDMLYLLYLVAESSGDCNRWINTIAADENLIASPDWWLLSHHGPVIEDNGIGLWHVLRL